MSDGIPDLQGCVNDARLLKQFLVNTYLIPESRITFLANQTATRSAIISCLLHLRDMDNGIEEGDAIVIFYAGHGSRVGAPTRWISGADTIETLCPHDERMIHKTGETIHGIPDRTINAILHDLSSVKGNNIVSVITIGIYCCI